MALTNLAKGWKIALIILAVVILIAAVLIIFNFRYYFAYKLSSEVFNIAEVQRTPGQITAMSCNVRTLSPSDTGKRSWYYRADLLLQNIKEASPDIIGFQEVTPVHYKFFQEKLIGYDSIITYRDDKPISEACPVFYRADAFELIDKDSFWLSETPDVMSKSWNSACYRICSYAILKEKQSGKEFIVFNTHLDHVSEEARIKGIEVVLDRIKKFEGRPSLLMGDFNAYEDSETYKMATEHFTDARYAAKLSSKAGTFHAYGQSESVIIDYIMVTPNAFEVEEFRVIDKTYGGAYSSDHNQVFVKLKFAE
ncbi:MAG TPA: endonuclease/exonuclease/phosphatase family protein [Clostridiales bacterium]|nr:endonuclease/exonuclease/phosphatase family protein [Clostridiales bacterium]HQD73016.1 endonuclease/exonuclease/phosphatase family protein [Clostridiales bacterium]